MKFVATELPDVVRVEPDVYRDSRGFFLETYQAAKYAEGGITATFVQDNHSLSGRGTLRGLHVQQERPQGKLVRVSRGEVFDVAVDIRRGSPTFGKFTTLLISEQNFLQLWVPPGFAHGFCVTSETAEFQYKCTDFYDPADEFTIAWDDPDIGIPWPVTEPSLSAKDTGAARLKDLLDRLPRFGGGKR